ncbi:helix-turn-helix transcriptional regulator [Brevibacterium linens]|uniref:Helix-turn-helix domain-containing protein n=1 Tax=Brevibacterium linens ATCC 9172 TaxID=1255617 RepID=A0A2H1IDK0_BRELN|nr:helix-turn-helix transcriptional regulator [Brevibacterium linens]KAB1946018.1 helix-turn-helix domain-containing protein [Brevibacterium linens ATCC 9172]SMX73288.1 Helix-turn-helix domain-containing protein [Brevibacterium linens ATCC 9172]
MPSHPNGHPGRAALGAFLRSRRQSLTPEDLGLDLTQPREGPGLFREEVAHRAGISVAYLARFEQGTATQASVAALNGLGRALMLDAHERDELFRLAETPPATRRREPPPEHVSIGTAQLLTAMADVPAIVLGTRDDVLAWNRLGHRLIASHLPFESPLDLDTRPNRVKMVFLDPRLRETYRDWKVEAQRAVTQLQQLATHRSDDLALMRLVGDLVVASDEFAAYWADPQPAAPTRGIRELYHPEVGDLDLRFEILTLEGSEQRLLTHSADPGSVSEERLRDLAALIPA